MNKAKLIGGAVGLLVFFGLRYWRESKLEDYRAARAELTNTPLVADPPLSCREAHNLATDTLRQTWGPAARIRDEELISPPSPMRIWCKANATAKPGVEPYNQVLKYSVSQRSGVLNVEF